MDVESDMRITEFFVALTLLIQAQRNLRKNDLDFIMGVIEVMKEHEKDN